MVIVEEKRVNLYGWKRAGGGYRPDGETVSCRPVSLVTIPHSGNFTGQVLFDTQPVISEPHRPITAPTTLDHPVKLVQGSSRSIKSTLAHATPPLKYHVLSSTSTSAWLVLVSR